MSVSLSVAPFSESVPSNLVPTARVVDVDADLDQMIRIAGEAPGPLLVTDGEKEPVGVISETALLRALYK